MVFCAEFLIHFIRGAVHRVHGVHAHAALKARPCLLTQKTLHFDFFHKVFCALVKMREAVDFFSGKMRFGRHQIFIFRLLCQFIRLFNRIHRGTNDRDVHPVFHEFTHEVNFKIHFSQAVFVLLGRFKSHDDSSWHCIYMEPQDLDVNGYNVMMNSLMSISGIRVAPIRFHSAFPLPVIIFLQHFHDKRVTGTTAGAKGCAAEFFASSLEFIHHGNNQSRAGSADRVSHADAGAYCVDFIQRNFQLAIAADHLCGKGFVEFKIINVLQFHFGKFQSIFYGRDNAHTHDAGFHGTRSRCDDARDGGYSQFFCLFGGHHDHAGPRVVKTRSVAGGDGAVFLEYGFEFAQGFHGWYRPWDVHPFRTGPGLFWF